MKKKFKYLILMIMIVTLSMIKIGDVNAAHVNDISKTPDGHWLQTFTDDAGNTFKYTCISQGLPSPDSSSDIDNIIYEIVSPSIDKIYATYGGDVDSLTYALRLYMYSIGMTTNGPDAKAGEKYKGIENFVSSLGKNTTFKEYNPMGITLEQIDKKPNGLNVTVTYKIINPNNKVNTNGIAWEVLNEDGNKASGWNVIKSDANTITISGTIKECEGANLQLKPKNSVTYETDGAIQYLYIPASKSNVQDGIIPVDGKIPVIGKVSGITVFVSDDNCDCSGSTNMTGLCNIGADSGIKQSYYVKDVEDNSIKKCVKSGKFKKYCGESIKKENDNNGFREKTVVSEHRPSKVNVNLADNPYCSVYCLEDINYDLPGVIDTQSATYFKLSDGLNGNKLTLTGKRTCYTGMIQKTLYVTDIKNKQQKIIEAYNDYNRALAYEESKATCVEFTGSCGTKYYKCDKIEYDYYTLSTDGNGSASYDVSKSVIDASYGKKYQEACSKVDKKGKCVGPMTCNLVEDIPDMNLVPNYATVEAHLTELDDIINKYKSCFEWTNNYCFNPIVWFTYNEVWDMDDELPGSAVVTNKEISKYFAGEPGDDYDSGSYNLSYDTITVNYLYPQEEKDAMKLQKVEINMSSQYVSKSVTKSKTFEDSTKEVWEYKTSGVVTDSSKCNGNDCKSLGFVFPVSLQQDKLDENINDSATPNETLRTYTLDFENLGVPGNDAQCDADYSRIMGKEDEKCSLYKTEKDEPESPVNKDYVCVYAVEDCPDCPPTCICPKDDPTCYVEDGVCYYKDCPDCVPFCVGCIHSSGDITFGYKQVSLSDIFPNSDNTDVGYNWNTDPEINKNADKAEETIKEIEDKKEAAYTEPQYSFTLSPTTMAKIRAYNDAANEEGSGVSTKTWGKGVKIEIPKGGYTNDTLERVEKDGNNYKSTFIDGLITMLDKDEYKRNEKWEAYPGNSSSWK